MKIKKYNNRDFINLQMLEPIIENNLDNNNLQDIPLGALREQINQINISPNYKMKVFTK